ncbi:MAG: RNA pseudouridine synthase [Oscillospiraceae bacterium]|nr:RNA pseudouridine synthase [Oscillospiraceae bacterium]
MKILYSDRDFVACIKPVGLDAEQDMPAQLKTQLGGEVFTLHRLDKNVGGVMIYARNKQAAAELSAGIARGDMVKEYLAVVHGNPPAEGDWEDLLFKDGRKNKVFVVKRQRAGVKAARLTYQVVRPGEETLVRIRLYTGRSHQIRVQFSSRGFPLVGDHKYGSRDVATAPKLFSCCITFPYRGQTYQFAAEPEWGREQ